MTRLLVYAFFSMGLFSGDFVTIAEEDEPIRYWLVENFTAPIEGKGAINWSADNDNARVGLAAARCDYQMDPKQKRADFLFPELRYKVPGSGALKLWIKADGSGNQLLLVLRQAERYYDDQGRRLYRGHKNFNLAVADVDTPNKPLVLDFAGWREIELNASAVSAAANYDVWLHQLQVIAPPSSNDQPAAEPKLSGRIWLDDMRLFSAEAKHSATFGVGLLGPTTRDFSDDVTLFLDVRSFHDVAAQISARVRMTDRNENLVVDRDLAIELAAGIGKETKLELKPDALASFLPPFKISGDILSGELVEVSKKFDYTIVMGNNRLLFDDMSDVFGRWRTAWYDIKGGYNGWLHSWTHGEGQRCTPFVDTKTAISRVPLELGPQADGDTQQRKLRQNRFAMRIDYQGETAIYVGHDRFFPGNAYKAGFWIKGNGTNTVLRAMFLDYSNLGSFWNRGWARLFNGAEFASGEREICTLDFNGWRYFEVPLPGGGLGTNLPGGSTQGVDFPIELTCLHVIPGQAAADSQAAAQNFQVGPIFVTTQSPASETLSVHLGYDDPNHVYNTKHGAAVTLQNGLRKGARQVRADWTLLDRDDVTIASGSGQFKLAAEAAKTFRIDLSAHAVEIAKHAAPLRLEVVAGDVQDISAIAKRAIVLSRPDSIIKLADFEMDRGFLGLRGEGISNAPPPGKMAARTSTAQKHSGQRSLAIDWDKQAGKTQFVSIDPPVAGIPTEISVWVHGDGSGVWFYPLIGDQRGVSHGLESRTWDFFFPRVRGPAASASSLTAAGRSQSAVRIDFQGWRKLTFHLPPIPPRWKEKQIVGWLPDYPLGVHLAVDTTEAVPTKGTLFVDDISLQAHISPGRRVVIQPIRSSESNVYASSEEIRFKLVNFDAKNSLVRRTVARVSDWRGRSLASIDQEITLGPQESRTVTLAESLPPGAYQLRAKFDGAEVAIEEDLLVADVGSLLGQDWPEALKTDWKLRPAIRDRFGHIDHDWDWIEFHPGNFQFDSLRRRIDFFRNRESDPWLLLGFSAYYAAGVGFEQMQRGAFQRRQRDIGHAIDTFLVPKRMQDWDNYCAEMMRAMGKDVAGWIIWDNPDGKSSLAVRPKKLAAMLRAADRWRRVYCAKTPLLIGGMRPDTALDYLRRLEGVERAIAVEAAQAGDAAAEQIESLKQRRYPLDYITGIHLRMDVGRLSPEDAQLEETIDTFHRQLNTAGRGDKQILITDLDWAVEKSGPAATGNRTDVFQQAAYLVRSDLLLKKFDIRPVLDVRNQDHERLGLGLAYRRRRSIPPIDEQLSTYQLKPSWSATARIRRLLDESELVSEVEIQDMIPGKTRCVLFRRRADSRFVAVVWRNNDPGIISFARTGLRVLAAEDALGTQVVSEQGGYACGLMPVLLTLAPSSEQPHRALRHLRVVDGGKPHWSQRVLAVIEPTSDDPRSVERFEYKQEGGRERRFDERNALGRYRRGRALNFTNAGKESMTLKVPAGSGVVLRKRYLLGETGQLADVLVAGEKIGQWDLRRGDKNLSGGVRRAIYVIREPALNDIPAADGSRTVQVEIRYHSPANTIAWHAFEYLGGEFPLSAVGALHSDQQVGHARAARNMIGSPLKIKKESFSNGIGVFSPSLLEYAVNGQFRKFTAEVGVDAATGGRGSVVFEVYGDGRKLWSSPLMSGLDKPRKVDINIAKVNRLRLIVNDGEDGNRFDAANWCEGALR
ncbi:MAG: NPCBM/NEW2 domain-containing protein [Planctomycetota bacterium]|nr:NPCBM/NEW2 domain-containing protein [Planctomycetota bacterium]